MPWSILTGIERSVLEKVRRCGAPLSEWNVSINYGVKTGYDSAFIIDDDRRNELVAEDERSADIIKPVLRGRDIVRWRDRWAGIWVITTFPALELDIDEYPAIKDHLESFGKERLEQSGRRLPEGGRARKRAANCWYETQDSIAYHAQFKEPKLFCVDMTERGGFCYSIRELYCNNSAFFLTGDSLKFLCAVLNSSLAWWFVKTTAPTSGMGVTRWIRFVIESIPVPKPTAVQEQALVELVDQILVEVDQDADADIGDLEAAIDDLVFDLYGLTEEEDTAVERALDLIHSTDEGEDAAILESMLNRSEEDRELVNPEIVMEMLRSTGAG